MVLCLVAATTGGDVGLYALIATSFFMSILFPTIFTMSLRGLGIYTKSGSSFLVMAIVGGAVFPPLMGVRLDASSTSTSRCSSRRSVSRSCSCSRGSRAAHVRPPHDAP